MITPLIEVVEGWTGLLGFTLKLDGEPIDLTGLSSIKIYLKDGKGGIVNQSSSGITVTSSTGGQLTYAPTSSDFVAAKTPYKVRFKVTDSQLKVVYFPNEDEDVIKVNVP